MIYEQLNEYTDEEIMEKLRNSSNDELKLVAMSVGEYHENYCKAELH